MNLTASATADQYERSLRVLLADDAVDAVVTIFVRPLAARAAEVARGIAAASDGADRPVLAVWLGADAPAAADAGAVPRFTTPEEAVRTLAHAVRHARRRAAPPDPPFEPTDADTATAATIVAEGLGRGGGWLAPADVERLLRCWGIPMVARRLARSAQAAGRAAVELGGPVALKAVAAGLVHKSDAGAVRLGLAGSAAVSRAAGAIARQLEAVGTTVEGFQVQLMPPEGPELIVGAVGDPAFGPLVVCGAGGVAVELLGDIQVRLAPLGPREADRMLRDLKTFPLLDGYRGRPRADLGSVRDLRHAGRRARGRTSRRRRARPRPGHRDARGRARRRRSHPGRRPGPRRDVPLAQRLSAGQRRTPQSGPWQGRLLGSASAGRVGDRLTVCTWTAREGLRRPSPSGPAVGGMLKGIAGHVMVNRNGRPPMANDAGKRAARAADAATERIRDLNEQILERIKSGGESALEAYERTLKTVADYQEAAGQRGAEWVTGLARAQAEFTRELASGSPAAARALGKRVDEVTDAAARQARRVPGEPRAEGAVRGAAARGQDLPIADYDDLRVAEINSRLPRLSEVDLSKVEAYERKNKKRKTVLQKIESLRNARG